MANGSFQKFVNNTLGLYCEYSWSQSISGNYSDVTVHPTRLATSLADSVEEMFLVPTV